MNLIKNKVNYHVLSCIMKGSKELKEKKNSKKE